MNPISSSAGTLFTKYLEEQKKALLPMNFISKKDKMGKSMMGRYSSSH